MLFIMTTPLLKFRVQALACACFPMGTLKAELLTFFPTRGRPKYLGMNYMGSPGSAVKLLVKRPGFRCEVVWEVSCIE